MSVSLKVLLTMYTCIELEIETGFANQLYCTFYVKKKCVFLGMG